ncbi:hypothetical protein INR49_004777 [Caranx melampygus]|nr:hypothetical protein INR49_004777 [Caranx melampygus]
MIVPVGKDEGFWDGISQGSFVCSLATPVLRGWSEERHHEADEEFSSAALHGEMPDCSDPSLKERKIQRERNNWADSEDHSRPEKTDSAEQLD